MSLATLYATHRPYVRGVVRTLGVGEPDVDDLTHEVFCVLLRRPLADTEPRGVRRWLYQTARRVVSNHRRGRRREALRLAHAWEPPAVTCPEGEVIRGEARARLDDAVAALPVDTQALYRLSEVEGLPGPAVAQRLGINPNTAYARVRALRRRLGQALLVIVLVLAALVARVGCEAETSSGAAVSRAPTASEASDERVAAVVVGPALPRAALGLVGLAGPR